MIKFVKDIIFWLGCLTRPKIKIKVDVDWFEILDVIGSEESHGLFIVLYKYKEPGKYWLAKIN